MNYMLTIMLAGVSGATMAQSLDNEIISAGGHFGNNAGGTLSATLGESFTNTLTSQNLMLTQGFQQPMFVITGITTVGDQKLKVRVYPNPTSDYLYITSDEEGLSFSILDLAGTEMAVGKLSLSENFISLNQYSVGVFFVKVYSESKHFTKTFKVSKL